MTHSHLDSILCLIWYIGWPYSTEIFRIKNNVQKAEGNLHYDIEWHPSLPNFLLNNIKTF